MSQKFDSELHLSKFNTTPLIVTVSSLVPELQIKLQMAKKFSKEL